MRTLLLHPEDSPLRGPWSRQRWDLIVDLGRSSLFTEERWSRLCNCTVLRTDQFRHGISDAKQIRACFRAGIGRLLDGQGIDWWDLLSVVMVPGALSSIVLTRLVDEIPKDGEIWMSRTGELSRILEVLLGRAVRSFFSGHLERSVARARHYVSLIGRFSAAQFKQILLDKYDSGYRWRARFVRSAKDCGQPVILLPSAYENVSRSGFAYAQMLPEQPFLMVATRQSAKKYAPPRNVQVRDLASYARVADSPAESQSLIDQWSKLKEDLKSYAELHSLIAAGVMDSFPDWIRDGVSARNAWRVVLERESVLGVLCGDDSNVYTRLPVLLAAHRGIPTLDFHHGAIDGLYLLKDLPSNLYLAKNEMERDYLLAFCGLPSERVVVGAPPHVERNAVGRGEENKQFAIFFSEPYEVGGMRAEEVYREILPPLCRVVRANGRRVLLKLHPFESSFERSRLLRSVLSVEERALVTVVDSPMTTELLAKAWFGMTVESSTAIDCQRSGVCCFLCSWLSLSPFEYSRQYFRFGIGQNLENAQQIEEIPRKLRLFQVSSPDGDSPQVDPHTLQRWLTARDYSAAGLAG